MNVYPIGNNLTVKWTLRYSDGTVFPLSLYDYDLSYRTSRGVKVATDTTVEDNVLRWMLKADDQVVSGPYSLALKISFAGNKAVDLQYNNAFALTSLSHGNGANVEFCIESNCDLIDFKDAVLKARKAMDLAQDAKNIAGSAVNTSGDAATTANEAKIIANNAKTVADHAKVTADATAATATQKAEEVAQKEAQLEAALNNLSTDQSGALALSTKVNEQGEKLSELDQKIDGLALGKFYGFFPAAEGLPAGDEPGYAYVGASSPFAIYVFNNGAWSNSGSVYGPAEGNCEDIDTNEQGKLQFANRPTTNGMGYTILRRDKTFAEQVMTANTIYEIRYNFVLPSNVNIPDNCVLMFEGGSISGVGIINCERLSVFNGKFSNKGIISTGGLEIMDTFFDCDNTDNDTFMLKAFYGNCIVTGCTFVNVKGGAIWSEYNNNAYIRDNIISGTYNAGDDGGTIPTTAAGIFFSAGDKDIVICGNTISNINGRGIKSLQMFQNVNCRIENNEISNVRCGGIVIMSTQTPGVVISGNRIKSANLELITGGKAIVADNAAINLHGSPNARVQNNYINNCLCLSIDIEGADPDALTSFIADNPSATIEEKLKVYQSRGSNIVIDNNTIILSMGMALSSCNNCKVTNNHFVNVFAKDELSCGIGVFNSSDNVISGNHLNVIKESQPNVSTIDTPCITIKSSSINIGGEALDFTNAINNNTVIDNQVSGTRTAIPLSRNGNEYVSIKGNTNKTNGVFLYMYEEDSNGVPFVNNQDKIERMAGLRTDDGYVRMDINDDSLLLYAIVTTSDAINSEDNMVLSILRPELNTNKNTAIVLPEYGLLRYPSTQIIGQYWNAGSVFAKITSGLAAIKKLMVAFIFEPARCHRYY